MERGHAVRESLRSCGSFILSTSDLRRLTGILPLELLPPPVWRHPLTPLCTERFLGPASRPQTLVVEMEAEGALALLADW